MSGQLRRSGRKRGPSTAAARRRVASQLTNISTCVPASTTQTTATTPISTLASMNTQVQAMTSNAPSSVDMSWDNVSSNTSTTTIIIPTWGPTVSAMPTVALSNTNQTTGMCMSTPTCTLTLGSVISKPDQIESMYTNIASNVAHSVKEKIYGSEYINLSALLLTNPAAKQGTQTLLFKGIILLSKLKLSLQVR